MRNLLLWFVGIVALCVAGCAGSKSETRGFGDLSVRMADAPDPTISSLQVTIGRVEAHVNGQWLEVETTPRTYELLDLVMTDTEIGSATLPAGDYTQIRLFPTSATVTDADGTHNVTIPSGAQTGIKINLNYEIDPNELTTILLDFNVDKSLIKQGNGQYRLQPVIPAVVKVLSGTITGTAVDAGGPLDNASVTATYTAGTSYALGTEVNVTSSLDDGRFKMWALLPGTYTLQFNWSNADGTVVRTATVTDVVVTANQNTDVGTVTLL